MRAPQCWKVDLRHYWNSPGCGADEADGNKNWTQTPNLTKHSSIAAARRHIPATENTIKVISVLTARSAPMTKKGGRQ